MPEYFAVAKIYRRKQEGEPEEVKSSPDIPIHIPADNNQWYNTILWKIIYKFYYTFEDFFRDTGSWTRGQDKARPLSPDSIEIVDDIEIAIEEKSKSEDDLDIQLQEAVVEISQPVKMPADNKPHEPSDEIPILIEDTQMTHSRDEDQQMQTDVRIAIRKEALTKANIHAREDVTLETGGALLGKYIHDKTSKVIVVITAIVRAHTAMREDVSVNITADTWADIWRRIDADSIYSDEKNWRMVGWYHTHPNFGIFFSPMDKTAHRRTFRNHNQVGLVIDPIRNDYGFFCWDQDNRDVIRCPEGSIERMTDSEILGLFRNEAGIELDSLPTAEINGFPRQVSKSQIHEPETTLLSETDNYQRVSDEQPTSLSRIREDIEEPSDPPKTIKPELGP